MAQDGQPGGGAERDEQPKGGAAPDGGAEPGNAAGPRDGADQKAVRHCYRHPDQETGISCVRCERPICPQCMVPASVGFQCPECVRTGSGTGHGPGANRPRTIAGGTVTADPKLVTKVLIGINVALFIAVQAVGNRLLDKLLLFGQAVTEPYGPLEGVAEGQWYRLLTSMFLHQEIWHILMNMLGLWFLGPPLEAALGRARFLTLYLVSGLGGGAVTYLLASPQQASLGASGAVFGLFGATAVLMRRLRYDMRPILVLLAINLVFTFTWKNIAWEAHVGGLVAGLVLAYAMVHTPRWGHLPDGGRKRRALVQYGTAALLLVVIAVLLVVRTLQLT